MIVRFQAKVIEPPKQIKAKYGFCSLLKCQVLNSGEDFVVFGKESDPKILSRDKGEVVSVFKDHTGKYRLLDGAVTQRNGNGLQPISEPLNKISQPDKIVGSGYIPESDEDDLDLPHPLTPKQKKDLKRLTEERAALLVCQLCFEE